jgi:predicted RNA-binding Zn ribbon-like protein
MAEESGITFTHIGGVLCLDFCNTANVDPNGELTEHLENYADLVIWAEESGALAHDEAIRLNEQAAHRPDEAAAALDQARLLRTMLYQTFAAVAHEASPDLSLLNAEISRIGSHRRIVLAEEGFSWGWQGDALNKMLWPVIWSAGELLVSGQLGFVRECAGSTCSWLFLDTSRNHSRRWCDMKDCGNRAKARRHYHRSKA